MSEQTGTDFVVGSFVDPWPLTPRARWLLWQGLRHLAAGLDGDLASVRAGMETVAEIADNKPSAAIHDFPLLVRRQPLEWWEQVLRAADRMGEAMRTGDSWNPRTLAEEAVVAVCIHSGWINVVYDEMGDDPAREAEFNAVPDVHEDDAAVRSDYGRGYPWEEILEALTGDADVEMLWSPEYDSFEDPDETSSRRLGVGDYYRPQSWHRFYDRHVDEPDTQSWLSGASGLRYSTSSSQS